MALTKGVKFTIIVIYIFADILLVGPFLAHNLPVVDSTIVEGLVVSSRSLDFKGLPEPIRLSVEYQNYSSLLLVKRLSPEENYAVLTDSTYSLGTFVVVKIYAQWFVDYRDLPIYAEWFVDKLVVASLIKSVPQSELQSIHPIWIFQAFGDPIGYGASIEKSLYSFAGQLLLNISTVIYYLGPLMPTFLAYLATKKIRLWSLVAVGWLYTLHIFLLNLVASSNKAQVGLGSTLLGYSTFGFIILTYMIYRFEVVKGHNILSKLLKTK